MVCPTISGKIVEWRDQVFSICFWPDSFIALTRFIKRSSAHGPFLVERPIYFLFPRLRPRTISASERLPFLRVRYPSVGLPHGVTGWPPGVWCASPPPCGWSTGFMATPRVCGRLPLCRFRPAFPTLTFWCSALESVPTVARHSPRTIRTSEDGSRRLTIGPSLATTWIAVPAERPSLPPCPGISSTLCTTVPVGIRASERELPGVMSAPSPETTSAPTRRP